MDTTETYIKMRKKAIPDLGMGIPVASEAYTGDQVPESIWIDSKGDWYYSTEDEAFQLERQDQLQEILEISYKELLFLLDVFIDVIDSTRRYDYITSMEQLWLAFVMKEKYNKTWNGDEWTSG